MTSGDTQSTDTIEPVPWWGQFLAQITVLSSIAVLIAIGVRSRCVSPPPPVDQPSPGTPLAGYCDAVSGHAPWLLLVAVPLAVLVGCVSLIRRRPVLGWLLVMAIIASLTANVTYEYSLDWAYGG
jgi:hypothetical protein